jgi:PAS domain S-box-containing protein
MRRLSRSSVRAALSVAALAALLVGTPFDSIPPTFTLLLFLISVGLVAFCSRFPILLPQTEINLAHVAGLGMLFAFGPVPALWSLVIGLVVGEAAHAFRSVGRRLGREFAAAFFHHLTAALTWQTLPLLGASAVYVWLGGRFPITQVGSHPAALGAFALAYLALYSFFLAFEVGGTPGQSAAFFRQNLLQLSALELLPLPLAVFTAAGYRLLGLSLILALGSVLAVTTFVLHGFSRARVQLARQIEENARLHAETERRAAELTRMLEVSSGVSATLNTQDVLKMICIAARDMAQAAGAAIFLLDTNRAELKLAYAAGLSDHFTVSNASLPLTQDERAPALTTNPPEVITGERVAQAAPRGWSQRLPAEGLSAYLSLPLKAQGEPVGSLVVFFRESPQFQPWTLEVLQAFGHQVALTIANTHLYTRTEQVLARRVRQLDALGVISREITATLDLQHVFDTIVSRARAETNAATGQLGVVDPTGQFLKFVAWEGLPPEVVAANRDTLWPLERGGVAGRVLRTGQAARVADVRRDPDYVVTDPTLRSELCVPILREERRLGVLVLESRQPEAFSEEDQAFAAQLAVQAAIAIDNARLFGEAQSRLREQSILYAAVAALASTLDMRVTYTAVSQQLTEAVDADLCVLSEYDADSGTLRKVEPRHLSGAYAAQDHPATARLLSERTALVVRADDPQAPAPEAQALKADGYRVVLKLPMIASDQVVGLVDLYVRQPRHFADSELRLAQALANQGAIAIQNARLFRRVSEGRDRLAAVLNSTREGVLVLEASGVISLVNPRLEEFWGVSARDIVGQNLLELLKRPDLNLAERLGFQRDEIMELLMTLKAGLALSIQTAQFQISDPRPRVIERSGAPVLDHLARAIGWVIVLRDITEEKEVEDMRGALSNMIVHDLRSPLNAVLASMHLIRDHVPTEHKSPVVAQALDVAFRSTNKVLGLVNNLLDISRMESGEGMLNRSAVNLDQLIAEVVTELTPLANEYGVFLIHERAGNLPRVWADRDKIGRVLTNLVDNALKFTPSGGQVRVRAGAASSNHAPNGAAGLECAVLDAGPGIPEDYRDRIFDRFAQIGGRQGRRSGTGLGLAFCKMAVEAHGGSIWVENRPEGGSKFSFTLPIEPS